MRTTWYNLKIFIDGELDSQLSSTDESYILDIQERVQKLKGVTTTIFTD